MELPQLLRARQAHIVQRALPHLHGALPSIIALQQPRILVLLEQLLLRIPRVYHNAYVYRVLAEQFLKMVYVQNVAQVWYPILNTLSV